MKEYQEEILETLKRGVSRTVKFGCQTLLAKLISIVVIVMVGLSIATGGILQFIIVVVGIGSIMYLAGNYNKDVEKLLDEGLDKITPDDDSKNSSSSNTKSSEPSNSNASKSSKSSTSK